MKDNLVVWKIIIFSIVIVIASRVGFNCGFTVGRQNINDTEIIDLEDRPFKFYEIRFDFNGPDAATITKEKLYQIAYLHSRGRQDEIIPFLENMKYCRECGIWHKNDQFYEKEISRSETIEVCKNNKHLKEWEKSPLWEYQYTDEQKTKFIEWFKKVCSQSNEEE